MEGGNAVPTNPTAQEPRKRYEVSGMNVAASMTTASNVGSSPLSPMTEGLPIPEQQPIAAPSPPSLSPYIPDLMQPQQQQQQQQQVPFALQPQQFVPVPVPAYSASVSVTTGIPSGSRTPPPMPDQHAGTPQELLKNLRTRYKVFLDQITPLLLYRWLSFLVFMLVFVLRMFTIHGFYIVAYVLFIFLLNQFILFLQPKDRSSLASSAGSENDGEESLPTAVTDFDTYRPFYRRLPEFKFWLSSTKAVLTAIICTFLPFCDVPVFWPILVIYSILLFFVTMKKQWMDMKRFKYVPWDIGGKQKYAGTAKSVASTEAAGAAAGAAAGSANQPANIKKKSTAAKAKSDY